MAKNNAVWGIDIGQCALKALRCTTNDQGEVVADAFDFIEYPKILSQPEADPETLVREALEQFLSRNDVRRDKVAISVSGQAGLSRFFKPPPVDVKMIPDIVKYEARQQIPFALEEVIWDYQQMGGTVVDGFALDTEVGLFAMKREQVFRAIRPFLNADIELDIVQLSPLCIYNFVVHDVLSDLPAPEDIDPDNPPESMVILAMGTETTDLVVTNGTRLWQRSIPLGGNHFTKQLSKELKLTYAKAEHLKRNARQAEDPKTIFQAMRPVFNDLVTEIQRSLGFFRSIDRHAKLGRMAILGNAAKLPGLRQYLEKNLGHEIAKVETFTKLSGPAVVTSPSFQENLLSFAVCYGLCLQGLGEAKLSTNLLPPEFLTERMIRAKKPWAVASVGALMLAFSFHFFCYYSNWYSTHPDRAEAGVDWKAAKNLVTSTDTVSKDHTSKDQAQVAQLDHLKEMGEQLVGNADRRLLWLELLMAIDTALPRNPNFVSKIPEVAEYPFDKRVELQIEHIETQYFPDLAVWFKNPEVQRIYQIEFQRRERVRKASPQAAPLADPNADPAAPANGLAPDATAAVDATAPVDANAVDGELVGPEGPGWVIEIQGHHFHNADQRNWAGAYVRNTLIHNLYEGKVQLPTPQGPVTFDMKELGIGYAILAEDGTPLPFTIPNPNYVPPQESGPAGAPGGNRVGVTRRNVAQLQPGRQPPAGRPLGRSAIPGRTPPGAALEDPNNPMYFQAKKHSFKVQFCWIENGMSKRLEERRKLEPPPTQVEPGEDNVATVARGGT